MGGRRTYSRRSVLAAGLGTASAAAAVSALDPSVMSFAEPPELAAPANPGPGLVQGYQGQPVPPAPASTVPAGP